MFFRLDFQEREYGVKISGDGFEQGKIVLDIFHRVKIVFCQKNRELCLQSSDWGKRTGKQDEISAFFVHFQRIGKRIVEKLLWQCEFRLIKFFQGIQKVFCLRRCVFQRIEGNGSKSATGRADTVFVRL